MNERITRTIHLSHVLTISLHFSSLLQQQTFAPLFFAFFSPSLLCYRNKNRKYVQHMSWEDFFFAVESLRRSERNECEIWNSEIVKNIEINNSTSPSSFHDLNSLFYVFFHSIFNIWKFFFWIHKLPCLPHLCSVLCRMQVTRLQKLSILESRRLQNQFHIWKNEVAANKCCRKWKNFKNWHFEHFKLHSTASISIFWILNALRDHHVVEFSRISRFEGFCGVKLKVKLYATKL